MFTIEFIEGEPEGQTKAKLEQVTAAVAAQAIESAESATRAEQFYDKIQAWAAKDIPSEEWGVWVREEFARQFSELEAQLAEAKAQWASPVYARLEKAEARAEAAETQLREANYRVQVRSDIAAENNWLREKAEADAGRLREVLYKVEWRASGAHMVCMVCGGLKRYAGHKSDCALQAALLPAATAEQQESEV